MYPQHLTALINGLKKFPGVGNRSAERFAFQMLTWDEEQRQQLATTIATTGEKIKDCAICGCLTDVDRCLYCDGAPRDATKLCVVATPREVFAVEETAQYRGLYHVLGGTLSPIEGRTPDQLRFAQLWPRLEGIEEVIIALDSTLEGDATALYLKKELSHHSIATSRLAFGLPAGCSLDIVDEGTLSRALTGRRDFGG